MNRLAHQVALVISSSSGVGKAMALRFGEEGATVVVWPDGWRSVSRSWRKLSRRTGEAWAIQTDVTDACQIQRKLLVHRPQHLFRLVAI